MPVRFCCRASIAPYETRKYPDLDEEHSAVDGSSVLIRTLPNLGCPGGGDAAMGDYEELLLLFTKRSQFVRRNDLPQSLWALIQVVLSVSPAVAEAHVTPCRAPFLVRLHNEREFVGCRHYTP